jgi:hypothetical protein
MNLEKFIQIGYADAEIDFTKAMIDAYSNVINFERTTDAIAFVAERFNHYSKLRTEKINESNHERLV